MQPKQTPPTMTIRTKQNNTTNTYNKIFYNYWNKTYTKQNL